MTTENTLEEARNNHVYRLNRYLPFSPVMEQIYEEYVTAKDSLNLETKALDYLRQAAASNARLMVLTGDAGHGKTHLCRRLLQDHLGYSEEEARGLINTACDGGHIIQHKSEDSSTRPLRIFKDFSEFALEVAARALEELPQDNAVTVICANEGRLRAILNCPEAGPRCRELSEDFIHSFENGQSTRDGLTHIINLNYQSVAVTGGNSLMGRTIHEWLSGTRWKACKQCSLQDRCPLLQNRNLLATSGDEMALQRRLRLETVFATAERLGIVITIREMLMAVAYLLTGGLTCEDVAARCRRRKSGWQHTYAFYNLLFEAPDRSVHQKLSRIPLIAELGRLDPGLRAIRSVDERLVNQQGQFAENQIDLLFDHTFDKQRQTIDAALGIDEIIGNPRNRSDRQQESAFIQQVVKSLRRRAFFDDVAIDDGTLMRRLGFNYGGDFLSIIAGDLSHAVLATLKTRFIAGLHTIQGLKLGAQQTNLYLVDPAFGRATSNAAIIARKIPSKFTRFLAMQDKWPINLAGTFQPASVSVDWLDRYIVFRIEDRSGPESDLIVDLMLFDFITRASGGYVAEEFYAHDIRRVTNFLGRLAEAQGIDGDDISLFLHGKMHSVAIDNGVVQVGGGN